MKKIIALIMLSFSKNIHTGVGCMSNSYNLSEPYDNKNYHHVACLCPCGKKDNKILADGTCSQCKHRHVARPQIYITYQREEK